MILLGLIFVGKRERDRYTGSHTGVATVPGDPCLSKRQCHDNIIPPRNDTIKANSHGPNSVHDCQGKDEFIISL